MTACQLVSSVLLVSSSGSDWESHWPSSVSQSWGDLLIT